MLTSSHSIPGIGLTLLLLVLSVCAGPAFADPPSRVARLSMLRGAVSFSPAGDNDWHAVDINRPLVGGDRVYADSGARAELDIGAATVRLNERSDFGILNLDDRLAQFQLTQGTFNLRVHRLYDDQRYEVDTPTLAFVISEPGEYRIDVAAHGDATSVSVFDGAGDVYGEDDAHYRVDQRLSFRFGDSRLRNVAVSDLPHPDDFDNWCFARDEYYDNAASQTYVSDEVIGAADLNAYGAWDDMPDYGAIWFPVRVAYGWAPYRDGYWAWIDPWGWTWVDNEPWGFAPFHYGRWVYVGNRWGWLPGPVARRPVYAPALVVFIGGGDWHAGHGRDGAPVGWCPLGPHDVYAPPYRVSRGYFTHVNAGDSREIDDDRINRRYDDYAHDRHGHDYLYRHNPAAVTAVSRDTFVHARPVAAGRLQLDDKELARAETGQNIAPPPIAASQVPATDNSHAAVPRESFHRGLIAHSAPPSPAAPFAARLQAIEHNGGRPLADNAQRQLDTRQSIGSRVAAPRRAPPVAPVPTPTLAAPGRGTSSETVPARERSVPENSIRIAPASGNSVPPSRETPHENRHPNEELAVPSTHYAPPLNPERHAGQATVERTPAPHESVPAEPRTAGGRPASQPDNTRHEDRNAPANTYTGERGGSAPVQAERHNDAVPSVDDSRNRTVEPHRYTREPAPAPASAKAPQAPPAESAPPRESRGNSTPSQQREASHRQQSAPPQDAPESGHERAERGQDAGRSADNGSQKQGAPDR